MATYKAIVELDTGKIISVGEITTQNITKYGEIEITATTPPQSGDTVSLTYAQKRQAAYKHESDPLYFAYIASVEEGAPQTDIDAAKQAWLNKRAEIKTRYPKV